MLLADGAIVVWIFLVFAVGLLGFFWVLATLIVRGLTAVASAIAGLFGRRPQVVHGPQARVCPRAGCYHVNRPDARYCARCGAPLPIEQP